MSRPGPSGGSGSGRSSDQDMRALLASYARYATLVRSQEEALDRDDMDRFEDLARAREEIQEELGDGPPPFPEEEELDSETKRYLERVWENFKDALLRDVRLRARLQKMKKDASTNLKTVEGRGDQAKGYLAGDEANSGERVNKLNVRS